MSEEQTSQEETIPSLVFNMETAQIHIQKPVGSEIFENGYFGIWIDDNTLCLKPEEILLLLDRGRIEVINENTGKKLSSEEYPVLLKFFPEALQVYSI